MRVIARMNVGGPAVQVTGLMRGLNHSEFDHRLYTGFCSANELDYLDSKAPDIKVNRIYGLGRRVDLVGDLKSFCALVKEIKDFKPHIIHTHTAKAGFLGRIASLVSLHPSIRIHTFHGHLLNGYFGKIKRKMVITSEQILAVFTHQFLSVGKIVSQDLIDAHIGNRRKFEIMPPGLGIGNLPRKEVALEFLNLSNKKLKCALIGRVTQIKRPDRFLDVVSEIKRRGVDIEFLIVGDGELLESCRNTISSLKLPVRVLGWQNNMEMVLAATDIVLLTSDNEGTPLSLIQAGMAGLPVVTTNVGSVPEVIMNDITGIITSIDVTEIADALEVLAGDSALRARMGFAAQEFTLSNFGVDRLVKDHELLYKKLLANRAKS
jgi:glycosyltransferase involved in cell wall biosynthesis